MAFIKRKKEQMHQNNIVYKKNRLQSILLSQDGMGVVEVILIIVVLIGLVIIFQTNIKGVVASIFSTIQKNAGSIRYSFNSGKRGASPVCVIINAMKKRKEIVSQP